MESTHDGVAPPEFMISLKIHRKEVTQMTAYEIISIFIGISALMMSFGSLIVALLAFLDKRNKRK